MFPKFLKIAFIPNQYLIRVQKNENNKTEITGGYEGRLLKDIAQAIGFDYELLTRQDGQYGWRDRDTGQFTGMLGMLDRGEVDFMFQKFAYDDDVFNHFSVIPFSSYRFTYATSKPKFESAESRFEMPFQAEVWMAGVVVYLLVTVVLWILLLKTKLYSKERAGETLPDRCHKRRTNRRPRQQIPQLGKLLKSDHDNREIQQVRRLNAFKHANNSTSFFDVAMQTLKIIFNQDITSRYLTLASTKAVFGIWVIGSMILSQSYSGSLLSFMTLPSLSKPIETVEQLANAVGKNGFKLHVGNRETVPAVIASNPLLVDVAVKIIKNDWIIDYKRKGLPREIDSKSAHVSPVEVLKLAYGVPPFASAFISEDILKVLQTGYIVRRSFCCIEKLSWYLNQMVESGLYDVYFYWQLLKQKISDPHIEKEESPVKALSLHNFKYLFYFYLLGLLLSCVALLLEMSNSRYQNLLNSKTVTLRTANSA